MEKESSKIIIRYSFVLIGVIIFGLVIYPGLYKYEKLDQRFPVKINRITGDAKILTINGWQDADDYDHALDLFAEYKQQVIDAMEGQSESIRNNVMNSVLNELQNAKNEIEKSLDLINVAFEKMLDDLFGKMAMDISTDISVLETLFSQEGLTKDDLKKQ